MSFKSEFAILDVKRGRKSLLKEIQRRKRTGDAQIEVLIRGTLQGPWGSDDGVSIEFQVDVEEVEVVNE